MTEPTKREARQLIIDDMVQAYQGGASIREIARANGCSYGCVHNRLSRAKVQFRGRGGNNRA